MMKHFERPKTLSIQKEIKMVFGLFDIDNDGFIRGDDIIITLKRYLSIIPSEKEMKSMIHLVDLDRDGKISYSEFYEFYARVMNYEIPEKYENMKKRRTLVAEAPVDDEMNTKENPDISISITSTPEPLSDIPFSNIDTKSTCISGALIKPRIFEEKEFELVESDNEEEEEKKEIIEDEEEDELELREEIPKEEFIESEDESISEEIKEDKQKEKVITPQIIIEEPNEEKNETKPEIKEETEEQEKIQTSKEQPLKEETECKRESSSETTHVEDTEEMTEDLTEPQENNDDSGNEEEKEKETIDTENYSPVLKQIERLQGYLLDEIEERRFYRGSKVHVPYAIQLFCNSFIGKEDVNYSSLVHDLLECKFGQEFTLEEFEQYKSLGPDDILIGDGDCLVVANMNDHNEDFEIYLVEDEESPADGPFKISDFLKTLEITVLPDFSDEEEEIIEESKNGQKLPPAPPLYLMTTAKQNSILDDDSKAQFLSQLKLGQLHLKKGEEKEVSEKVLQYEVEKKQNLSIQEQIKEKISEGNFVLKKTVVKKREKRMEREHELLFTAQL
eukprot:gene9609-1811_t